MSSERRTHRRLLAWICLAVAGPATAFPPLRGLTVEAAIETLRQDGLRVFYSTDLVRPGMTVRREPAAADPAAALDEILEPWSLATSDGPNGTRLIVRLAAAGEPEPDPQAAPPPPDFVPGPPRLEEIVVAASRYSLHRDTGGSPMLLTERDIESLPDLGDDALRAVGRLPGTATSGMSAKANVRGGEVGETLLRFDGLRLYDPFHLKDFQSVFSSVDPRIVSTMQVYTGGFPAVFGDRMSGVIDVASMLAPEALYHEVGVSFFNSSVLSTGRFADGDGEWVASARRSNLDLLYRAFSEQPERPRYLDTFAKLSYKLGEHHRVTGSILRSNDDITLADDVDREERAQSNHEDSYVWFRVDHRLDARTQGATIVARARLESDRFGTSEKSGISTGTLAETKDFAVDTLQSEWSTALSEYLVVQYGASASRLEGRYRYEDEVEFDLLFAVPGAPTATDRARMLAATPSGGQYALFANVRYSLTERLTGDFGLRWDKQTLDDAHSDTLSPRVGIRYALGPDTDLRLTWGRFAQSQSITELQVSDGIARFYPPQRSDHLVLGLQHAFPEGMSLRVEVYDKKMMRLRPRFENILNSRILLPELKPDRIRIAPLSARARGLEVMLDGRLDDSLRWWAAYTWSRVVDRLNEGEVPRSWDQTHALSTGLDWSAEKWSLGLGVAYRSGWPITDGISLDATRAVPTATVTDRNGSRLGFFRSLDLKVTREIELTRSSVAVTFELTNVLGRENPCCIEYEIGDEEEAGDLSFGALSYLPRIPSVGFLWRF